MQLFQFDDVELLPAEQIGSHSQENWELVLLLKGSGTRTIGNLTKNMQPGEVILIPPHITHCWHFEDRDTIVNISITFPSSTLARIVELSPDIARKINVLAELDGAIEYHGEVKRNVTEIILEMRKMSAAFRIPRFMELLLLLGDTSSSGNAGKPEKLNSAEKRFERFRIYCRCNYMRQITLADVAAHIGMNKSAACTFIKHHTGTTFSAYINKIRLDKVEEIIRHKVRSSEPVTIWETAYQVGFRTIPYFNTCFLRRHGCSPSAYIRRLRNEIV